jgi:hypothetical protein
LNFTNKLIELQKVPCPVRFILAEKPFIVEIQYFVIPALRCQTAVETAFLVFAVNTDGFNLLVDADSSSDLVLQDEFGNIDSLDVTLGDLLNATRVSL